MSHMVSSTDAPRRRKPPAERRAEIVARAASIALAEGLERVTLRAVAEQLDVRPGLITHYFAAVESLVAAAFAHAIDQEREVLFCSQGSPHEQIAQLVARVQDPEAVEVARLWLNARHLSRFLPGLAETVEEQESLDRDRLAAIIEEGVRSGDFRVHDPFAACVRILIAIDGYGAYANSAAAFDVPSYTRWVADATEWSLGLDPGSLRIDS